jgi:hypothetical protein
MVDRAQVNVCQIDRADREHDRYRHGNTVGTTNSNVSLCGSLRILALTYPMAENHLLRSRETENLAYEGRLRASPTFKMALGKLRRKLPKSA